MKLTHIAVVAAALFGGANAAGPRDGRMDGDERGIDCGGASQDACTCWTDMLIKDNALPPTLVNEDVDRGATATPRETGLVTYDHDADAGAVTEDKTFLEVVIDLDASVYTEAATHASGLHPAVWQNGDADPDGLGGTLTKSPADKYLAPYTNGFVTTNRYANPRVFFVNNANDVMPNCHFNAEGELPSVHSTENTNAGALFIERTSNAAATQYGTNGDNCQHADNRVRTHLRTEFKPTIGDCGFESSIVAADNIDGTDTSDAKTDDEIVGNSYTRYLGRVKIETTRQNGELAGEENVLKQEFAFQITVLFPNTLTVTSSPVSIIGEATHEAALTHQIYDSANENLNLNMLIGTTFPYAVTTLDTSAPTKDDAVPGDIASLKLNSDQSLTPFIAGATLALQDNVDGNWEKYCDPTDDSITRGAAYYDNIICDHDDSKDVSLGDFVEVINAGDATYTYGASGPADADHFGVAAPGGSALPTERCIGENTSPADQNAQACLQNTFMRLKPRKSYCDFNLALTLTVNAVCRDDYNGDGTNTDSIQSTFWDETAAEGSEKTNVAGWPITSTNRLFNPDGSILNCDSAEYRENIEAQEILNFQLASDDFCPRVIATGALNTPEMSIYESSFGESTWGAHGYADATAAQAAVDETIQSSACVANAHLTGGQTMCLQVPGYAAEAQSPTANQRKLQDEFVFGTTSYIETRIAVSSGVNIDKTEITDLWIGRSETTDATPVARDLDTQFPSGATDDVGAANGLWQKQVITGKAVVASGQTYTAADTSTVTSMVPFVKLSNNIVTDSLILESDGTTTNNFFNTNPALKGTEAAKLGNAFEGVSRVTVEMNKYTVLITDQFGELPEPIAFYANIDITYKAANVQGELGQKRSVKGQAQLPEGAVNRARSLAAPAVTGGQASAQAGVRTSAASGSAGGASTIAGFSSTTVLAAAAVLGAVVVAAGASFFVVRKRRAAAAKTAKRSSSSTELNDTAQVQV